MPALHRQPLLRACADLHPAEQRLAVANDVTTPVERIEHARRGRGSGPRLDVGRERLPGRRRHLVRDAVLDSRFLEIALPVQQPLHIQHQHPARVRAVAPARLDRRAQRVEQLIGALHDQFMAGALERVEHAQQQLSADRIDAARFRHVQRQRRVGHRERLQVLERLHDVGANRRRQLHDRAVALRVDSRTRGLIVEPARRGILEAQRVLHRQLLEAGLVAALLHELEHHQPGAFGGQAQPVGLDRRAQHGLGGLVLSVGKQDRGLVQRRTRVAGTQFDRFDSVAGRILARIERLFGLGWGGLHFQRGQLGIFLACGQRLARSRGAQHGIGCYVVARGAAWPQEVLRHLRLDRVDLGRSGHSQVAGQFPVRDRVLGGCEARR